MLILGVGIKVAKLPNVVESLDETTGKWAQFFADDAGNILNATDLISGGALTILRVFMFLVPVPLCIIGYIVYKKKYTLYGERYDKIKAEIDQRRLENAEKVETGEQNQALDTKEETTQEIKEVACDIAEAPSGEEQ